MDCMDFISQNWVKLLLSRENLKMKLPMDAYIEKSMPNNSKAFAIPFQQYYEAIKTASTRPHIMRVLFGY